MHIPPLDGIAYFIYSLHKHTYKLELQMKNGKDHWLVHRLEEMDFLRLLK